MDVIDLLRKLNIYLTLFTIFAEYLFLPTVVISISNFEQPAKSAIHQEANFRTVRPLLD